MSRFIVKFTGFIVLGVLLFFLSGTYWGVWGEINTPHFDLILASLPPWQKQELADALNSSSPDYGYGLAVRPPHCPPTADGIADQLVWFYRNPGAPALKNSIPTYHQIVREIYTRAFRNEISRITYDSTIDYELALARKYRQDRGPIDRLSQLKREPAEVKPGFNLTSATVNPFVGAAMKVLTLIRNAQDDAARAVPGIVDFMRLRCWNFIYTFAALWLLAGVVMLLTGRGGGGKAKGKGKNKGTSPAPKKKAPKRK